MLMVKLLSVMAEIPFNLNSGDFCCSISELVPSSFTFSLLIFFATEIPSQPLLGRHLYFTTIFTKEFLNRATLFTAWLFLSGYHIFLVSYFSLPQGKEFMERYDLYIMSVASRIKISYFLWRYINN